MRSLDEIGVRDLLISFLDRTVWLRLVVRALPFPRFVSQTTGHSSSGWVRKWLERSRLARQDTPHRTGVVKQIVDHVKTSHSARTMACADELLDLLKHWRQTTQFSAPEDWIFASAYKLGRQLLGYTYVWNNLGSAVLKAGIGHVSSHTFRHTSRMWLDKVGTTVGVQQKLMRHADIRTAMNIYGDEDSFDMRSAHEKVVHLAIPQD